MRFRTLPAVLLIPALALAACDSDSSLGTGGDITGGRATVQFINTTNTSLDIATDNTVANGNGALSYGTASTCITTNATIPGITVRITGTSTPLPDFVPRFDPGGNYTVIAYPGALGLGQFLTLSNAFTPLPGQAGLRVVNVGATGTSYDVYVSAPNAALGIVSNVNNVGVGTGSSYFNVSASSAQQVRITNAGSRVIQLDLGSFIIFTPNTRSTLVITAPGVGLTVPRAFIMPGC
jgi:predicted small secreted protein